jgi:MFS family permease
MYPIEGLAQLLKTRRMANSMPMVSRTVILLGFTSLFTDISSEMIATVLPLYMMFSLGLPPLLLGIIDGLYQGVSALVRLASGVFADKRQNHKQIAAAGYGLSTLCRALLLLVGGAWAVIAGVVLLDRIGKGIRTAPRDALISLSTPPERLGMAFGVHRAMDTFGAMIGPLLAFALLALMPGAYDAVFVVSFCVALVGLGVITLLVEHRAAPVAPETPPVSMRAALDLLRGAPFRALVIAGALLSVTTVSDTFLYLGLQRQSGMPPQYFPLLFVATAVVFMVLAVPTGWLADRIGRRAVFAVGYLALLGAYAMPLVLQGPSLGGLGVVGTVLLLGVYYAATDGVLMAIAGGLLPEHMRASGMALLTTATSLGRLASSLVFGALWSAWGLETALVAMLVALAVTLVCATPALMRPERRSA